MLDTTAEVAQVFEAFSTLSPSDVIDMALGAARAHLGMELAFVAETGGGEHVVRFTNGDTSTTGVRRHQRRRLEETICGLVLAGQLPNVIADTRSVPALRGYPVRGYAAVPITLRDGSTFGMLCVVSTRRRRLTARHLEALHLLGDVVARQIEGQHQRWTTHCGQLMAVSSAVAAGDPRIAHQPIVDLHDGRVVGAEALARFESQPSQPSNLWFSQAWAVGYGSELELQAVERALTTLSALPDDTFLSINVSPKLPHLDAFAALMERVPLHRVVLELTEHCRLDDPGALRSALRGLRRRGLRIAVDDAGAGFAGLTRILDLNPDFIKLDASLVRYVHADPSRAALAAALVMFATSMGCTIIAEGVEKPAQADVLSHLGIHLAQGYLIGRPAIPNS
jgi:EAL domain-containing protein (putative c-di-GMP-specific phosphodiesterase class I)